MRPQNPQEAARAADREAQRLAEAEEAARQKAAASGGERSPLAEASEEEIDDLFKGLGDDKDRAA